MNKKTEITQTLDQEGSQGKATADEQINVDIGALLPKLASVIRGHPRLP